MKNKNIATAEEFLDAYLLLSPLEQVRLFAAIRSYCVGNCDFQQAEDLFNELTVRVGDGKRNWDKNEPFMDFVIASCKSIANNNRRSFRNARPHISLDSCAEEPDLRLHFEANPHASAEEVFEARQRREAAVSAFEFARRSLAGDPLAQQVLDGLELDMTPAEMRAEFDIGKEAFHAARARVSSRLSLWAEKQARREQGRGASGPGSHNNNRSGRTQ